MAETIDGSFDIVATNVDGEYQSTFLPAVRSADDYERIAREFVADLDVSENSRQTYRRQLRRWFDWLESRGVLVLDVNRRDVLQYRDELKDAGFSVYSVNGYLTAVRRLYDWIESNKSGYTSPAAKVKGLRKPKNHARDAFTADQLRTISDKLTPTTDDDVASLRDFAMFELAARCGLRTVEIARATYGDIRRVNGQRVLYVHGKGRESADEFVKINAKVWQPLRAYLDARPDKLTTETPLFASLSRKNAGQAMTARSVSRILKSAIKDAGIDERTLTPHSLRHSAVTIAVENGATLENVQAMARHASPTTTMIYFHNRKRLENAAEDAVDY